MDVQQETFVVILTASGTFILGFNGSRKPPGRFLWEKSASLAKFVCPNRDCGRIFNWKRNLTRHLKYECGLQPRFKCPYCEYFGKLKGFKGSSCRTNCHVIKPVHWLKNRTQFPCPNANCRSVFAWKRNLTSHLRYQCGQQPRFKCPYCDYVCKVKADIRKHIKVKHSNSDVYVIDISQAWKVLR
ncbi:hypothetical protein KM043_007652 [Ampulex compressa]|nr:hypothetical protein KM043_007652 [Ampulex compressa]